MIRLHGLMDTIYFDILILIILFGSMFVYKSFFLKLVMLTNFYPMIVTFAFRNKFPMSGSLFSFGKYYNDQIASYGFYWQVVGYIVLFLTLLPLRKHIPYFKPIKFNTKSRAIILFAVVFFAAIAFPSVFHLSDRRFNLLPGNGWASLYIGSTVLFILSSGSKRTILDKIYLVFILFMIVSGSRADNLLIFLFFILYKWRDGLKVEFFSLKKFFLPGIAMFILGVSVGFLRFHEFDFQVLLNVLVYSLYAQGTAMDAVHTYLSSIWFYVNHDPYYEVYLNTPFTVLPGTPYGGVASAVNYTQVMKGYIHNYGGGMFYAEGVMNFGLFGMIMYNFVYGTIILLVTKYRNLLTDILFIFLFLMQLRLQWYGLLYIIKPFIIACFFLFLIWGLTNRKPMIESYKRILS